MAFKGGKKTKELTPDRLARGHTLLTSNKHMDLHSREGGCVEWSVGSSLGSSSPDLCSCMFLGSFPHRVMDFLHMFPPRFQIVIFPFHTLGMKTQGNVPKTAAEISHDSQDAGHLSKKMLRAGHQQWLSSWSITGPPSQKRVIQRGQQPGPNDVVT